MPYAVRLEEGSSFAVASELSSVEMLAGHGKLFPIGDSLVVRANSSYSDTFETRYEHSISAPLEWKADRSKCRSCRQSMQCCAAGGTEVITRNPKLWHGCEIIRHITFEHEEYARKGISFDNRPRVIGEHDLLVAGFQITDKLSMFSKPEDWEVDSARSIMSGYAPHVAFIARFSMRKPTSIGQLYWGDDAILVYKAFHKAKAEERAPSLKIVNDFKKAECSRCVYKCKLNSHQVTNIASRRAIHPFTGKKCAVTKENLEKPWDNGISRSTLMSHMIAGMRLDKNRDLMVCGRHPGYIGRLKVIKTKPPYRVDKTAHHLEDVCRDHGIDIGELNRRIDTMGDKAKLTCWFLDELNSWCTKNGSRTRLFSGKRFSRNDILYIMLEVRDGDPVVTIGSDNRSHTHGGRNGISKDARIFGIERPRYRTTYSYPFFDDINRLIGIQFGSGKER